MNPFLNVTSGGLITSEKTINVSVNKIPADVFGEIDVPLASLTDVNLTNIKDQDVIKFDGILLQWINT